MRPDFVAFGMKDEELWIGIRDLKRKEKGIQAEFIAHLSEIDKRKLYAVKGFPSLFQFMVEELGYSESSALKRIQIARKAQTVVVLYYALLEGKTSLGALSKICPYLTQGNADVLLKEIEGKTVRETERLLAKRFPKADVKDSIRRSATPLSVDRVYFRFSASEAFEKKVEKLRNLLSHKYPEGRLEDLFEEALDTLIEKIEKPRQPVARQTNMKRFMPRDPAKPFDSRYVPVGVRREVWKKDNQSCSYTSPDGRRCNAKSFLQLDHIHPWILGGSSHDPKNLRVLCATHNRLRSS